MRRFTKSIIKRWNLTGFTNQHAQCFIHDTCLYLYKEKDGIKIYFSNGNQEGVHDGFLWIYIISGSQYRYVKVAWQILNVTGNYLDDVINREIQKHFNKASLN